MTETTKNQPVSRKTAKELAQEQAMKEIKMATDRRHAKTAELRRLRMQNENKSAQNFLKWRASQEAS